MANTVGTVELQQLKQRHEQKVNRLPATTSPRVPALDKVVPAANPPTLFPPHYPYSCSSLGLANSNRGRLGPAHRLVYLILLSCDWLVMVVDLVVVVVMVVMVASVVLFIFMSVNPCYAASLGYADGPFSFISISTFQISKK